MLVWSLISFGVVGAYLSIGLFLGSLGGSILQSPNRVFNALGQDEMLFCAFFTQGAIWIISTETGEDLRSFTHTWSIPR